MCYTFGSIRCCSNRFWIPLLCRYRFLNLCCYFFSRGYKLVLSSEPILQNPAKRTLSKYKERMLRSVSFDFKSIIYRVSQKARHLINKRTKAYHSIFKISLILHKAQPNLDLIPKSLKFDEGQLPGDKGDSLFQS